MICKHVLDLNECEMGLCDIKERANCQNTPGSYYCSCIAPYQGNGTVCECEYTNPMYKYQCGAFI